MKKHIARFLLLSAVIFLASACARDEFQSLKKGDSLVFRGRIENTDTRTVVLSDGTEGKVYWVDGDEVRINGIPYIATVDEEDPRSATFTKKDENDPDPEPYEGMYYATYSCTYDPEIEVGQLPPSQYYADNSPMCAPMFAQSESADLFLAFKNINALLEITLKGTGTIRSIKLSSDNVGMTGKFAVKDGQSAYIVDEDKKAVTLYCISGVPVNEEGVKFYVSIPSGEYEAMNVLITDIAGNTWETTAKNTAVVESNKIYPLTFEASFPISDFTGFGAKYTDDGGKTWYGAESLAEALENIAGKNKSRSIIEVLEDSELGANALPDLSGKAITIIGNGHVWDISERTERMGTDAKTDVKFEGLVFDGKSAKVDCRLAYNLGALTFTNCEFNDIIYAHSETGKCGIILNEGILTFDTMKIKGCSSETSGSVYGGIVANYGGTLNTTATKVDDCQSVGTGDSVRGAFVYNTSSGIANISGTTFNNCTSACGGAIYHYSGTLNLSKCQFNDCVVTVNGGAIYANGGTMDIKDCSFAGCSNNSNGGAIYNYAKTTITNSVFTNCSSMYGGAIDNRNQLTVKGGDINNCTASSWGGGIYNTANALLNLDGAYINDCTGLSGGCVSVNSGTVNIYEGTLIKLVNVSSYAVSKTTNSTAATINMYGGTIWAAKSRSLSMASKGGTFNLYGGTIMSDNPTSSPIYIKTSTLNISETDPENPVAVKGIESAIYVDASTVDISGGSFTSTKDSGMEVWAGTAESKITVSGGTFTAPANYGIYVDRNDDSAKKVTLEITGGKFDSKSYSVSCGRAPAGSSIVISGGLYSKISDTMKSKLKSGLAFIDNGDGFYKVGEASEGSKRMARNESLVDDNDGNW
ncbi:MAG: right-handed parallel beta-helix repeat-containing protein [Bacteroidales bacterium]|nr:right-handed parallel beta-helix repeat-containing protein [Bacteroidales bacterium]